MEQFLANINSYLAQSPALAYAAAFLGGIGVSLTPCVYPIIPITVALVGAKAGNSRIRGFFLSLIYVTGISTTYAFLGAFAALSGRLFGQLSASPWVNFLLGNIFILLGLSMLDVFTFTFPAFLGRIRPKSEGKGFFTMYVMGLVSGLVAGPCTAAVLAALLAFVAARHNVAYGMSLLFTFSMGMGVLLIIIGTFAGILAALPKAGGWTEKVKKAMGWIMIFIGEYFLVQMGRLLI